MVSLNATSDCALLKTTKDWEGVIFIIDDVIDPVVAFLCFEVAATRSDWLITMETLVTWSTFACKSNVTHGCCRIKWDT